MGVSAESDRAATYNSLSSVAQMSTWTYGLLAFAPTYFSAAALVGVHRF